MKKCILFSAIVIACSSISLINTSCICQKVPQFIQAQSLITEADQTLQEAKSLMDVASNIPDNVREEFDIQLQKAQEGLRNASKGLAEATQACAISNIPEIFKDFNATWAIIRNLIPIIASYSKSGKAKIGASLANAPVIRDPICFSMR